MAKAPALKIPSSKVEIALAAGTVAAGMKSADATAGKLYFVPTGAIKAIPGFNVRVSTPDYIAHRDMIAGSIRENGYDETKPLSGYVAKEGDENVIYVTDGHTRLDAIGTLGEDAPAKVPVIVRATAPSLSDLTVALHTNNTGRPLTPFELGVVVKRLLKEDGADKAKVAGRLAVTPRYLDDVLLLVNSPKPVREAVLNGQVSSTMAIQELRKAGDEPQKATDRITTAVEKATAAGKTKATAKDAGGVKMKKIKTTVEIVDGADMKEIVKSVAANVRAAVVAKADGEGDDAVKLAAVAGTITIVVEVPAPVKADPIVKAAKTKAAAKPAPAKTPAKGKKVDVDASAAGTEAAKEAVLKGKAAAKPAAKKGTAKKTAAVVQTPPAEENISADDETETGDLGIEGAEEVTSEGIDDEPAIMPPAVKNGEGVPADEEADI